MAKCKRCVPIKFLVLLAHVKSIVLANAMVINNYFYVLLLILIFKNVLDSTGASSTTLDYDKSKQ